MEKLTILSPHYDDSSFSLGLALCQWRALPLQITVVNFFTQSAYAPHIPATTVAEISAVREEEDRQALTFAHPDIRIISLQLLDAPLRLSIPFSQIMQRESADKISSQELRNLSQLVSEHCADGLTIAPLGIGSHVDHIAVHRAAVNSIPAEQLAFYEDLPYVSWTSPTSLQESIKSVQSKTGIPLEPLLVQTPMAMEQKQRIASFYKSQITGEEANAIAQFSQTYGNGERLWIPANMEIWRVIKSLPKGTPQMATPHQPK